MFRCSSYLSCFLSKPLHLCNRLRSHAQGKPRFGLRPRLKSFPTGELINKRPDIWLEEGTHMERKGSFNMNCAVVSAIAFLAIIIAPLTAQQPAAAQGGRGAGRGGVAPSFFTALDADNDGPLPR